MWLQTHLKLDKVNNASGISSSDYLPTSSHYNILPRKLVLELYIRNLRSDHWMTFQQKTNPFKSIALSSNCIYLRFHFKYNISFIFKNICLFHQKKFTNKISVYLKLEKGVYKKINIYFIFKIKRKCI